MTRGPHVCAKKMHVRRVEASVSVYSLGKLFFVREKAIIVGDITVNIATFYVKPSGFFKPFPM